MNKHVLLVLLVGCIGAVTMVQARVDTSGITIAVEKIANPEPHVPGSHNIVSSAARGVGRLIRNVTVEAGRFAGNVGKGAYTLASDVGKGAYQFAGTVGKGTAGLASTVGKSTTGLVKNTSGAVVQTVRESAARIANPRHLNKQKQSDDEPTGEAGADDAELKQTPTEETAAETVEAETAAPESK